MPLTNAQKTTLKADLLNDLTNRGAETPNDLNLSLVQGFGPASAITIPYQSASVIIDQLHEALNDEVNQGIVEGVIAIVESVEEFANNIVDEMADDLPGDSGGGGGGS